MEFLIFPHRDDHQSGNGQCLHDAQNPPGEGPLAIGALAVFCRRRCLAAGAQVLVVKGIVVFMLQPGHDLPAAGGTGLRRHNGSRLTGRMGDIAALFAAATTRVVVSLPITHKIVVKIVGGGSHIATDIAGFVAIVGKDMQLQAALFVTAIAGVVMGLLVGRPDILEAMDMVEKEAPGHILASPAQAPVLTEPPEQMGR